MKQIIPQKVNGKTGVEFFKQQDQWVLEVGQAVGRGEVRGIQSYVLLFMQKIHQSKKTGTSWVAYATLAKECGLSVDTVKRAIRAGLKAGLIAKVRRRLNGDGTPGPIEYAYLTD